MEKILTSEEREEILLEGFRRYINIPSFWKLQEIKNYFYKLQKEKKSDIKQWSNAVAYIMQQMELNIQMKLLKGEYWIQLENREQVELFKKFCKEQSGKITQAKSEILS